MSNLIRKRDSERYINNYIKKKIELNAIDTTKISDGDNTFKELYEIIGSLAKLNYTLADNLEYWLELATETEET